MTTSFPSQWKKDPNWKPTAARQYAMCRGKESYDRATASRVVRETKQRANRGRQAGRDIEPSKLRISAYECPFCGHWHIGSPDKKPSAKRNVK